MPGRSQVETKSEGISERVLGLKERAFTSQRTNLGLLARGRKIEKSRLKCPSGGLPNGHSGPEQAKNVCAAPTRRILYARGLSDGVTVAQGPLEAFVMVRIHVGQPNFLFK